MVAGKRCRYCARLPARPRRVLTSLKSFPCGYAWDSVARNDKRHVSYVVLQTQLTHWRLVSPALEILCFYLMCRSSGTIHTRCIDSGCTLAPLSSYLTGSPVSEGPWTVTIWECMAKHLLGYCTTTVHSAATAEASATVAAVAAHIIGSSAGFHLSDVPVWRWYYQMVKNFV